MTKTATEMVMRSTWAQAQLTGIDSVFQSVMRDVLRKGTAAAYFKIDDRPRGYSQSHWRKLKKQRVRSWPTTITLKRVNMHL